MNKLINKFWDNSLYLFLTMVFTGTIATVFQGEDTQRYTQATIDRTISSCNTIELEWIKARCYKALGEELNTNDIDYYLFLIMVTLSAVGIFNGLKLVKWFLSDYYVWPEKSIKAFFDLLQKISKKSDDVPMVEEVSRFIIYTGFTLAGSLVLSFVILKL